MLKGWSATQAITESELFTHTACGYMLIARGQAILLHIMG